MIDVSIIVPIYKGKKYLNYLIEILMKNFDHYEEIYKLQCEAIIVNDYPKENLEIQEQKISVFII